VLQSGAKIVHRLSFYIVETANELEAALALRRRVFVDEQGVAQALEIDEFDDIDGAIHVVAWDGERVVGAGRLRLLGAGAAKLERVAVQKNERGHGIGRALTEYLEWIAKDRKVTQLKLHAQQSARGFYEKLGYVPFGAPFEEAGITHIAMRKDL
jgi:predicted GNAT family N-acyltransferase